MNISYAIGNCVIIMCENQIKNQFQKVSNEMTEMSGAKSEKNQKESDDLLWTMPLELISSA